MLMGLRADVPFWFRSKKKTIEETLYTQTTYESSHEVAIEPRQSDDCRTGVHWVRDQDHSIQSPTLIGMDHTEI